MKLSLCLSALAIAAVSTSASAAPTINFTPGSGALPANVTVIQNFDSYAPGTSIGSNAYALNTSSGNGAIPAFGSTGNYGSVLGGGSYSISFAPTTTLAFVLGSLDTYNTVKLFFANNTSATYSGSGIVNVAPPPYADGNQVAAYSNGAVSYNVGSGPKIVGAEFDSGSNSFEFDNIATAATAAPEPAAWAMMILGMGAVGAAMRKRRAAAPLLAA